MESEKNWRNLALYACPICSSPLHQVGMLDDKHRCTQCSFEIRVERFDQIVSRVRATPQEKWRNSIVDQIERNLSELNNLGRPLMSEDFSDSPHLT